MGFVMAGLMGSAAVVVDSDGLERGYGLGDRLRGRAFFNFMIYRDRCISLLVD